MADRGKRKHEKEVSRRKKIAARDRSLRDRRLTAAQAEGYPEIRYAGDADPAFEAAVRTVAGRSDFWDGWDLTGLPPAARRNMRGLLRLVRSEGAGAAVFRILREIGGEAAVTRTKDSVAAGRPLAGDFELDCAFAALPLAVRREVFRRAAADLEPHLFYNNVFFEFFAGTNGSPDGFVGKFTRLKSRKGIGGTTYYSPYLPKIEVDGRPLIVGFSKHAIEQFFERFSPDWRTHAGHGSAFGLLYHGVRYDPVSLSGGTPAFSFYVPCGNDLFRTFRYVLGVLGEDAAGDERNFYCRAGYCPAVAESIYFKAKTFLHPGYGKTPEAELIRRSDLPPAEKRDLLRRAANLSHEQLYAGDGLEVIRWFHEHGVPQVIRTSEPVLRYREDELPPVFGVTSST